MLSAALLSELLDFVWNPTLCLKSSQSHALMRGPVTHLVWTGTRFLSVNLTDTTRGIVIEEMKGVEETAVIVITITMTEKIVGGTITGRRNSSLMRGDHAALAVAAGTDGSLPRGMTTGEIVVTMTTGETEATTTGKTTEEVARSSL